ncbi:MAG TPA: NAD(P)/FAD-dependent oxidoreductase [Baekduia sp.]|nr:NAD(P)/FAD-dependent oxidoreductase [Baekduia sp.]
MPTSHARPDVEVAIIGAGFGGLGAGRALTRAGFDDLVLLDEADGVGGTWHWNTYPGVAVDIPSFSYQYSYAQRADWTRVYAPGQELKAYAEHCADAFGLRPKIRLRTKVAQAAWDDAGRQWSLALGDGSTMTARHVVGATGVFAQPKPPEIAGLETFRGATVHTARWDHDVQFAGRRVAVIGTGASAVQLIPAIAAEVADLTVFQRTPVWCLPKPDAALPEPLRWALGKLPGAKWAGRMVSHGYVEATFPLAAHFADVLPLARASEKLALKHLRDQVQDPELRTKLTPGYSLGCKRPTFHNSYYRTFNRENVQLVVDPIERVTERGVRTADGTEHEVDVLVLATGFKVFEPENMPPFPVQGAGGADLGAHFLEHRLHAYEGVSVPGFPNLFLLLGPYGYNGSSYFTLIENQSRHVVRCLRRARDRGATRVEVRPEANERFFAQMLGRRHRQVFFRGSCATANSYYFDAHGDVPFRPSTTIEAAWRSARFPLDDYRFEGAAA